MSLDHIDAYPLCWPDGFPRTADRKPSRFQMKNWHGTTLRSEAQARDEMFDELERLGASEYIVSTNLELRRDGLPYANRRAPADPGVAVYFILDGHQHVLACDRWRTVGENYRALTLTVQAMRGLDRWGASDILKRAFTGFKALPERGSGRPWWVVLDVSSSAPDDEIRAAYRSRAKETHPDAGGSAEEFREVQEALNQAIQ